MHANDYATYVGIGFIVRKGALDPGNLSIVELIVGGIV